MAGWLVGSVGLFAWLIWLVCWLVDWSVWSVDFVDRVWMLRWFDRLVQFDWLLAFVGWFGSVWFGLIGWTRVTKTGVAILGQNTSG